MSDPFHALDSTLSQVWLRLARGVRDRHSAARTPTLATTSATGPQARTVILREVDPHSKLLEINADRRSGKVAELETEPRATLHIWDAKAHLQIRLRCAAKLIHGDPEKWAAIPETAQRVYGGTPAPGAAIPAPDAHDATADQGDFTAVIFTVHEIETLYLGQDHHRRARFSAQTDWAGQWLAP